MSYCTSLIHFAISEHLSNRKSVTTSEMIQEIKKMKEMTDVTEDHSDIIKVIETIYILHIKENVGMQHVDDMLQFIAEFPSNVNNEDEEWRDTLSLFNAITYLKYITSKTAAADDDGVISDTKMNKHQMHNYGLIDIEEFILKLHKKLLNDNNGGGKFSTEGRRGSHNGEEHYYPKFASEEEARKQIQSLIDLYNPLVEHAKKLLKENSTTALETLFRIASWLLFTLLYYHPFRDGNGRLARLLTSYTLSLFNPFPTPIYDVFSPSSRDEYLSALVEARKKKDALGALSAPDDQKESDALGTLTALMIESSYYTWKSFTNAIKDKKDGNDWKESLITSAISIQKQLKHTETSGLK